MNMPELVLIPHTFKCRVGICFGLLRMQLRLLFRGVATMHPMVKQHLYMDMREFQSEIDKHVMDALMKAVVEDASEGATGDNESRKPTVH